MTIHLSLKFQIYVLTQYQEVIMTNSYTWKHLIQLSIASKVNSIKYHKAEFITNSLYCLGLGVFPYNSNVDACSSSLYTNHILLYQCLYSCT
jgi:hypothetical protein